MPIDSDGQGYYDLRIEWRTYTPDGRTLTVTRSGDRWRVSCDGSDSEGPHLIEVLRDAVGQERGEGLILGAAGAASVEQWIRETAAHIVGDTLH